MIVHEIWRYPVKSIGGERLTTAHVSQYGISGDRGWGIVDRTTGMVLTARRSPLLLFASARVDADGQVQIVLPDATVVRVGAEG
ncbi:MAG: domain protein beta barrel domain protein, partial [Ilumatobacteraceae bacterium]|nr:domain protein beta barrel domain protein [Ilumatobacteraceae bacterium]